MNKEYLAYEGKRFSIEWYYDTRHKSQPLEYYKSLHSSERIKILLLFKRMAEDGKIYDKTRFNYEGEQIYAFKPASERFLCFFFKNKKIIITNAFCKKRQKLPQNEKEKALKSKSSYELRVERGQYYE